MDVVEAINHWIDDQLDDLDDDELEAILQVLDVIDASVSAHLPANHVDNDDIDDMIGYFSDPDQAQLAEQVVIEALTNPGRVVDADGGRPDFWIDDRAGPEWEDEVVWEDEVDWEHATVLDEPTQTDPDLLDLDTESARTDTDDLDPDEIEAPENDRSLDVLDDLDANGAEPVGELDLVDVGDPLGPTFLDAPDERTKPPLRRYAFATMFVASLVLFLAGAVQLFSSVDDTEPVAGTGAQPTAIAGDRPTPDEAETGPTAEPTAADDESTDGSAGSAAVPTVEDEPPPPADVAAIRLESGDVVAADLLDQNPLEFRTVYDASELAPAVNIGFAGDALWIATDNGDLHLVELDDDDGPSLVWEADDDLPPAMMAARLQARIAVVSIDGQVIAFPADEVADAETVTTLWDPSEETGAAIDVASLADLMVFVTDVGSVELVVSSADDALLEIWNADGQPPAANAAPSSGGFLIGVFPGGIARYLLDQDGGAPFELIWDPFGDEQIPAIAYSSAGNRVAVVLQDGSILLADETGTGEKVWDPAQTEVLALAVEATASDAIVLLESSSVVRIPLDGRDRPIGSLWDITDVSLSPARQIAVLDR